MEKLTAYIISIVLNFYQHIDISVNIFSFAWVQIDIRGWVDIFIIMYNSLQKTPASNTTNIYNRYVYLFKNSKIVTHLSVLFIILLFL